MKVFIPKEVRSDERRVSVTPEITKKMTKAGFDITIESGAGAGSFIDDDAYAKAGAHVVTDLEKAYQDAQIVIKVQPPMDHPAVGKHEADLLASGSILVASIVPQNDLDLVKRLMERKISCFSMNLIPRITIAQKMDTLSSQSNIAGYKAVLIAANNLGKYFPLLMTAAGTITPAKVVVMGAGVAGLQAIATARRLGALVEAFDVRAVVKEQVESLGAKFIEVEPDENMEDEGGYAKESSEDYKKRQAEAIERHIAAADIAITTALIPGRKAPILITEEMVESMKPGSVIVDLAAEMGGNCALTEPGTVVKHGVTIVGEMNITSLMSIDASKVFARNIWNFLDHLSNEGQLDIDVEEVVTNGSLMTHDGALRHEPTKELMDKGA